MQRKKSATASTSAEGESSSFEGSTPSPPSISSSSTARRKKVGFVSIPMSAEKLKEAVVDIVTVNGRPLSTVEDSGFRKILDPIVRAIQSTDPNFALNRKNVRKWVSEEAHRLRETIRKETKDIMVCLKLDTASRLERSILGISIQFYKEGRLAIRSLCLKQLYVQHTAENLKAEVTKVLSSYGIRIEQVYTGTTDNAANMVKLIKDLKGEAPSPEESASCGEDAGYDGSDETDEESGEDIADNDADDESNSSGNEEGSDNEDGDSEDDSTTQQEERIRATNAEYFRWPAEVEEYLCSLAQHGVEGVRCAAHTVQLSVLDALKSRQVSGRVLKKARKLCKSLRKQITRDILRALGLPVPSLDVITRWSSTLRMLLDLLEIKKRSEKTLKLSKISLTDQEWKEVEDIAKSLQPAHLTTKILQAEQLTVGDFLSVWLRCKLDTGDINHPIAREIVNSMNRREKVLFQSDAISGAVYLDPRYQVLLSNDAKKRARSHLEALHKKLQMLAEKEEEVSEVHVVEEEDGEESEDDPVERHLKQQAARQKQKTEPKKSSIKTILQDFECAPRLPSKANIFQYWESQKKVYPELYNLAKVALSVPMTQVTEERMFSHLNFVLSVLRSNLDPELVEDILCVRINKMFMAKG